jgi:DNA-binding response OmpR family regulator
MAGKKILIVDYDSNSLEALAQLFGASEFEIVKAMDGLSAWDKYKLERPDLVILEAMLPRFHGFDLARRIHQESRGAVPVVIVTGVYRGSQYRNEALTSFGASDFFEKPWDSEKLLSSVQNLLREKAEFGLDLPQPEAVIAFLRNRLSPGDEKAERSPKN